jgi:NAD(P)-dependent dehydrogenase (short-subunit alcohol dehydrogenase family)
VWTSDTARQGIDAALEATIGASWSRLGFAARRRLWSWADDERPTMEGRVVLVTGGTSGIGRAVVVALARAGATVGLVGRDEARVSRAVEDLRTEAGSTRLFGQPADLGSLSSVRALADGVARRTDRLDALVHAAGVLNRELTMTDGGLEETAAVHVVGPYLLTCLLEPLLRRAAPARVVWVSSGGMYTRQLDVERLDQPSTPYRGTTVYATAKRAQVALARQWDQRWPRAGVSSYAMHPGWVDTDALRTGLPVFAAVLGPILRRAEQGADTAVWLADGGADADAPATFWLDRRARPDHRWPGPADPPGEPARLWEWCRQRAGLDEPVGGDR